MGRYINGPGKVITTAATTETQKKLVSVLSVDATFRVKTAYIAKLIAENSKIQRLINDFNVPLRKVAIELNGEILDKKKLNQIKIKKNEANKKYISQSVQGPLDEKQGKIN